MKIFSLQKNVINIQKCLITDSEYLKENYGRHCVVNVPGTSYGIIVKIGLCEPKQVLNALFIDDSVIIFKNSNRARKSIHSKDVEYKHFQLLASVQSANRVSVTVVFNNINYLLDKKKNFNSLFLIIKEILKLYVFSYNSIVFLQNLSPKQTNGIFCLEIGDINGKCSQKNIDIFNVIEKSEITIKECMSREKYEQCYCFKKEIKLGGLHNIYKSLKETIEFSKIVEKGTQNFKPNTKILLVGPSGCGKTSLVHCVARECKCIIVNVLIPEIYSPLPGETEKNLQNIFDRAKFHAENEETCVILIEDINLLCKRDKKEISSTLTRAFYKLISLLEELDDVAGVVVIATANDVDDVDTQLMRVKRFNDELEIMIPTNEQREEIICNVLDYFNVNCSEKVVRNFACWTPGFVGADLHLAIQESLLMYKRIKDGLNDLNYQALENCFKKVISNITPVSLKGSIGLQIKKNTDFSRIGGLNDIKKLLDFSVKHQLLYPDMFIRMGIPLTKGILLYGPPGCAKTTLVKALAKESNMTFLAVSSADLYSPFVGDPEKKIIKLFSQARLGAPAIIFIDEIDSLIGSKSGDRSRGVQERVLSALLIEMDGVGQRSTTHRRTSINLSSNSDDKESKSSCEIVRSEIIVIAATNRPERIDDALKRPGRFDKIVYVPPPNEKERFNILKKLTENIPLNDSVDLTFIAKKTNFYSGADLKNLCYESALLALTQSEMTASFVEQTHFNEVLEKLRPSLNAEMIDFYESYQRKFY